MLAEVLDYLNNHFVRTVEKIGDIVTDGIEGDFTGRYVVGQWVAIDGSIVNDGVYQVLSVSDIKLELDATLMAESPLYAFVFGLAVPKTVQDIATKVATYNATSKAGVSSESQGNRSVSYKDSSNWTDAFRSNLSTYRRVYDDKMVLRTHMLQRNLRWYDVV